MAVKEELALRTPLGQQFLSVMDDLDWTEKGPTIESCRKAGLPVYSKGGKPVRSGPLLRLIRIVEGVRPSRFLTSDSPHHRMIGIDPAAFARVL